ncbi:MAG: glycosyltransferase family 39 protein [Candidatus Omnitrophica bacterium]|nr:glycosyltransferase family 39 protein [Candidatus Omnitrophota bacterium]
MPQKNNSTFLLILIFIFLCLLINIITIKNGHNWGGDFAQYIIHAKNLVEGNSYQAGIMLDLPLLYPPGYPLIIALIIKYFGTSFFILKFLNVIFWSGFVYFSYRLASGLLGKELGILLALFLAVSSDFFTFKQNVLSDVPFSFFCVLSVFMYDKTCPKSQLRVNKKIAYLFLTIFCMIFAMLTRSGGLTLFIAGIFHSFFIRKDIKQGLIFCVAFALTYLLQIALIGNNPGYFNQIIEGPLEYFNLALRNISLPLRSLLWFFTPGITNYSMIIFFVLNNVMLYTAGFIYLAMLYFFIRRVIRKEVSFLESFSFFYLLMLLAWSGFPAEPRAFARYIYPLVPIIFVVLCKSAEYMTSVFKKNKEVSGLSRGLTVFLIILLVFINIYNIVLAFDFNDDVLFVRENQEMFRWVEGNVKDDQPYMTWRPAPVALMSGKAGVAPWSTHKDPLSGMFRKIGQYKVGHLIASKETDKFLIDICERKSNFADLEWENSAFKIYKIRKAFNE